MTWITISFYSHVGIIFFMGGISAYWPHPPREEIQMVELVDPEKPIPQELSLSTSHPVPIQGDRQVSSRSRALLSLAPDPSSGARGLEIAAAQSQLLVGRDRQSLVAQLYNHPQRHMVSPRQEEQHSPVRDHFSSAGSNEPNPFFETEMASGTHGGQEASPSVNTDHETQPRTQDNLPRAELGVVLSEANMVGQEQLSRIATDGLSNDPRQHHPRHSPLPNSTHARPRLTNPQHVPFAAAANQPFPDVMDMAQPSNTGTGTGRGSGERGGRRGAPAGKEHGQPIWLTSRDGRYIHYFRSIYEKVQPLWLFPKELEILFAQGDVIIQFTIHTDGSVENIRIKKSSGYRTFDQNVVAAIRKASPFQPIPRQLGNQLDIIAPFEFANPMVR